MRSFRLGGRSEPNQIASCALLLNFLLGIRERSAQKSVVSVRRVSGLQIVGDLLGLESRSC